MSDGENYRCPETVSQASRKSRVTAQTRTFPQRITYTDRNKNWNMSRCVKLIRSTRGCAVITVQTVVLPTSWSAINISSTDSDLASCSASRGPWSPVRLSTRSELPSEPFISLMGAGVRGWVGDNPAIGRSVFGWIDAEFGNWTYYRSLIFVFEISRQYTKGRQKEKQQKKQKKIKSSPRAI